MKKDLKRKPTLQKVRREMNERHRFDTEHFQSYLFSRGKLRKKSPPLGNERE